MVVERKHPRAEVLREGGNIGESKSATHRSESTVTAEALIGTRSTGTVGSGTATCRNHWHAAVRSRSLWSVGIDDMRKGALIPPPFCVSFTKLGT